MDGNPTEFRPPDPLVGVEGARFQSSTDLTEGSSSTSTDLREEVVQVATIEAEMDEFRYNSEINRNTSGMIGESQRMDVQKGLGRDESHEFDPAKSQSTVAAKSQERVAATSSSTQVRSEGIQQ